ncbi:glycoside hydrolase N-terminal domain-containing protein [Paenibacillus sp. FSL K6-1566]|uniref:glycoside hydrolase N-terminal domain-containing protein n=1 Tax=Paenibacillus sp. FSL K6-1566 TaxID=2954515 RepID=UPI003100FDB3
MGNQGLNMDGRQRFDAEVKARIMGTDEASLSGGVERPLRLWYTSPAAEWNEALPIGNGRLGGMVFGRTGLERVQLNEDSLWYGGPGRGGQPECYPIFGRHPAIASGWPSSGGRASGPDGNDLFAEI